MRGRHHLWAGPAVLTVLVAPQGYVAFALCWAATQAGGLCLQRGVLMLRCGLLSVTGNAHNYCFHYAAWFQQHVCA
jgi:hypothetical protein